MSNTERFERRYTRGAPEECWPWQGSLDNGYGRFWIKGKTDIAHRFAWELANGPIPDGLQIDHLCRNRACVNPAHMEPVDIGENVLRGVGLSALNAKKTKCLNGHTFDPANTYIRPDGSRACRTCAVERTRAWRQRKKESSEG